MIRSGSLEVSEVQAYTISSPLLGSSSMPLLLVGDGMNRERRLASHYDFSALDIILANAYRLSQNKEDEEE